MIFVTEQNYTFPHNTHEKHEPWTTTTDEAPINTILRGTANCVFFYDLHEENKTNPYKI